jgi:formylglycine-generating enzyme required for sulfatase activity
VHQVAISRPFYIGKYEVTQGQWDAVMGRRDRMRRWGAKNASRLRKEWLGPNKPMFRVSWNDWQEFIAALKKKVHGSRTGRALDRARGGPIQGEFGYEFALPTEAQWEYACRAGSKGEYCFGDDRALLSEYAWICPDDAPHPSERDWPDLSVGGRKPNAWGIHDMHGSVWELCADWWDKHYYSKSPLRDPPGAAAGCFKVVRGGAVNNYGRFARSAFRQFIPPEARDDPRPLLVGARLVINLPSTNPSARSTPRCRRAHE